MPSNLYIMNTLTSNIAELLLFVLAVFIFRQCIFVAHLLVAYFKYSTDCLTPGVFGLIVPQHVIDPDLMVTNVVYEPYVRTAVTPAGAIYFYFVAVEFSSS